jgi:metal-responsive CopG/Arc/MetJ family transcriptional regulator
MDEESNEYKKRYHIWLHPETIGKADGAFRADNCKSRSEFVEKAIEFYAAYLSCEKTGAFLPVEVSSVMEGKLEGFENRISKLLFKLAVEQGMMMHIIACDTDIDDVQLDRLRGQCVGDVKRTNGQFSFKDALKYQKSL